VACSLPALSALTEQADTSESESESESETGVTPRRKRGAKGPGPSRGAARLRAVHVAEQRARSIKAELSPPPGVNKRTASVVSGVALLEGAGVLAQLLAAVALSQ
jgi:hypothetical protein